MTATTDARAAIVTALEAAVTVKVYPVAPATPIAPSVSIAAGTPWLVPLAIGSRLTVTAKWRLLVTVKDAAAQMDSLEAMVEAILVALPDGFVVEAVAPPQSLDTGAQGSVLVAEITVTATIAETE